jgi:hypothetical protein
LAGCNPADSCRQLPTKIKAKEGRNANLLRPLRR